MNNEDTLNQLATDLEYITATPMRRRMFLATFPLIVTGCATKTADRYREGSNKGQKTKITVNDEIKMTKEYLPKMQKDYPAFKNSFLQGYLNRIGQKVVKANGLHGAPYKYNFTLVNSKAVNAFALPAGTVFVTGPLLTMASSEAELAGVIGHEIGHIKARHTAERLDTAKKQQTKSAWYAIGGGLGGLLLGEVIGRGVCKPKDQECLNRIRKYGALAGAAGGLLIQKYGFMANSREDEMEADRIGFRTSVKAGYHKDHVGRFYEKLLEMEKKHQQKQNQVIASFADAMSTHPPSKERVKQMYQMAKKLGSQSNARISSKDFERAQALVKKLMS